MVSGKFTVINKLGLHMRPASNFVQAMAKYQSNIDILFNGKKVNGKSILQVMTACIKCGAEIEIQCSGSDEEEMLKAAGEMIRSGLGDEV